MTAPSNHQEVTVYRIAPVDPSKTETPAAPLFATIQQTLGSVPNLFRTLGHAPAALEGYLQLHGVLAKGRFSASLRERIALTVAEANQCQYCLAAHSFLGARVGLTDADLQDARQARAADPHVDAVLKLTRCLVVRRGELDDASLAAARAAGVSDADIVETVAHVAVNTFSNYINHVARTPIDFPEAAPLADATEACLAAR
ncbi:MAG: carboxymuconolactone decarboxylase family protein [Vicinamibacterales bacterium]